MGGKIADKTGKIFGRLKVIKQEGWYTFPASGNREAKWLCECKCGNSLVVRGSGLISNKTRSCGCLKIDTITKHGMHKSPEYTAYSHMVDRCTNPNAKAYKDYGGRGIKICKRWLGKNGFINFLEDMGKKPSKELQLDREENNKGYNPDNCRWTTPVINTNNRRITDILEYRGEKKGLWQWVREFNIEPPTLEWRLDNGWSLHKALTTKVTKSPSNKKQGRKKPKYK